LRWATVPEQSGLKKWATAVTLSVGGAGSHLTKCRLGRGLHPYLCTKRHFDPSSRLATVHQRYKTHRQTDTQTVRQRSDSIGRTVLQTVAHIINLLSTPVYHHVVSLSYACVTLPFPLRNILSHVYSSYASCTKLCFYIFKTHLKQLNSFLFEYFVNY